MNSVAQNDKDIVSRALTSVQQRRMIPEEETSSSNTAVNQSFMSTLTSKKTNNSTDNIECEQLKYTNQPERYNSLWKYPLMILYGVLGILLLTALILPSIIVYLLTPKSSQAGFPKLSTYRNHCAGISPYSRWQINSTITITMVINTTQCHFQETPLYFVTMAGLGSHFCLGGYGAIYLPTNESFQVYTRDICYGMNSTALLAWSQSSVFEINWIGFYK